MVSVCTDVSVLKLRVVVTSFAATWMQLEIVTLSEVSQTQKDKYHMILVTCGSYKKGTK